MNLFSWRTFDVRSILPAGWSEKILDVAARCERVKVLEPPHVTSRESPDVEALIIRGVGAAPVSEELPWLISLYENEFLALAQTTTTEPVTIAQGAKHTVVLNVQRTGDMRYECHVDTNPIQGLLYVTNQPEGAGGDLRVANRPEAHSQAEIDVDCSLIYPQHGYLVFFDARIHPHYITPLVRPDDLRVVAAMNYYVPSCPEAFRPEDLDDYLYGRPPKPGDTAERRS